MQINPVSNNYYLIHTIDSDQLWRTLFRRLLFAIQRQPLMTRAKAIILFAQMGATHYWSVKEWQFSFVENQAYKMIISITTKKFRTHSQSDIRPYLQIFLHYLVNTIRLRKDPLYMRLARTKPVYIFACVVKTLQRNLMIFAHV